MLERAREARVSPIVVSGCCLRSSRQAQQLASAQGHAVPLYFTAGVHPHNAKVPCRALPTQHRPPASPSRTARS